MDMRLSQLLNYENIIVQCHNNPDADAIASGYAVFKYLKSHGKNVRLVYGGNFEISKSNLKLMVSDLNIHMHFVRYQEQLNELCGLGRDELPDLLITVDSQYGEGNIQKFEAKEIAIIDHHQISSALPALAEVRSYQASCATVVWDMLRTEDYDINKDLDLGTALYYGLMTDSNNFSELHHPLDMDMRDEIKYRISDITKFKNSNISQEELRIAGIALLGSEYYRDNHYSIVKTDPCDPNVLGIISDMFLEVEDVDCCLVYSIHEGGIKISVRSCVKEVKADELASYICAGVGDGGGHLIKAGGSIRRKLLEKNELDYTPPTIQQFFRTRMKEYFQDNEIIYADRYQADIDSMDKYRKKFLHVGYVKASDVVEPHTNCIVRTLEGDVEMEVLEDTVIAIGIKGEIYPMTWDSFITKYKPVDEEYVYPGQYSPTIKNAEDGKSKELLPHAHSCVSIGSSEIYAKELNHRTKIFTRWDPEHYYLGKPGDYMAASATDTSDVYIVARDIFSETYDKI
ncbi:MAG: DHH family phosphoesterase [Pseudobutyrivibrio sp.]|nr:DHH family phosphoesterase [Pseudobutyrivibrio sp.]